jgi:hypothetical protein
MLKVKSIMPVRAQYSSIQLFNLTQLLHKLRRFIQFFIPFRQYRLQVIEVVNSLGR